MLRLAAVYKAPVNAVNAVNAVRCKCLVVYVCKTRIAAMVTKEMAKVCMRGGRLMQHSFVLQIERT